MKRFVAGFMALWLTACAGANYRVPQLSAAEVQQAARDIEADVPKELPVYKRDPAAYELWLMSIAGRLQEAAQPMCREAEIKSCFFEVSFVDDDEVNAYATDGNRITMHRGLLELLETEDEVAAVMAHEVGHHVAEHLSEKRNNAIAGAVIASILLVGLAAATGTTPNQALTNDVINSGANIGALSYSKEQEREADLVGAYLLARAGYDLESAARVWKVFASLSDRNTSGLFDTHPAGPERLVAWQKTIAEVEASDDLLPDVDTD